MLPPSGSNGSRGSEGADNGELVNKNVESPVVVIIGSSRSIGANVEVVLVGDVASAVVVVVVVGEVTKLVVETVVVVVPTVEEVVTGLYGVKME